MRIKVEYQGPLNVVLDEKICQAMEKIGATWYAQGTCLVTGVRDLVFDLKHESLTLPLPAPWGWTLLKGAAK